MTNDIFSDPKSFPLAQSMCPWWVTCSMWTWGTSASPWPSWPGSMGACSPCLWAGHLWWSSMTMTQSRNVLTRQSSLADLEISQELSSRRGKLESQPQRANTGRHRENSSWPILLISQAYCQTSFRADSFKFNKIKILQDLESRVWRTWWWTRWMILRPGSGRRRASPWLWATNSTSASSTYSGAWPAAGGWYPQTSYYIVFLFQMFRKLHAQQQEFQAVYECIDKLTQVCKCQDRKQDEVF